mmetsp:Transcript_33851/g.83178  ORF Transcript_33851/g.83178 Transcript_33851/m.83178 type:complete len:103 (+) Transcript_33851:1616-1924(+)
MAEAEAESSPEVGSSQKSTIGSLISARAIDSRRFCPPDSPLTNWFPHLVFSQLLSPSVLISCSTRALRSWSGSGSARSAAYWSVSRHVRKGLWESSCSTSAI